MPTVETLERFIARVEQNAHAEAIEEFYTTNASMQENQATPRVGRDALVANERSVLAKAKTLTSTCVRPLFVSGLVNGVAQAPVLDISARVSYGGERGMLSLAFDPQFAANGNVFVYFTDLNGDIAIAALPTDIRRWCLSTCPAIG
jgi:hypothetical protein